MNEESKAIVENAREKTTTSNYVSDAAIIRRSVQYKMTCLMCQDKTCENLEGGLTKTWYCCFDVPAKHITKPLRDWVCNMCILRRSVNL